MKKTAQGIPRIGLAKVSGEHLTPANDPLPPSEMKKLKDKDWHYTPSGATDIRKTFQRIRRELAKKEPK